MNETHDTAREGRQHAVLPQAFRGIHAVPADGGRLIVLTAPLTETIDHAGYFIQMSMASLPMWLEGILNRKYPNWRDVERTPGRLGA